MRTITAVAELDAMAPGDIILVGSNNTAWTKQDDGRWLVEGAEGSPMGAGVFTASIEQGAVKVRQPPRQGDWFYTDEPNSLYFYVARVRHDEILVATWQTGGYEWRGLRNHVPDEARSLGRSSVSSAVLRQVPMVPDMVAGYDAAEQVRLLQSGADLTPKPRVVSVEVEGTFEFTPNASTLEEIHGVVIEAVPSVIGRWSKHTTVEVDTPWSCACDQVTEDGIDLNGFDGTITEFKVTGCEAVA